MIDLDDVQSLILRPSKHATVTVDFVRFRSRNGMRLFLRLAAGLVTTAADATSALAASPEDAEPPPTLTVAVTAAGLDLAGIDARARRALPTAFLGGMQAAAHRLGDVGENSPASWVDPFQAGDALDVAGPVHAAVIVHGILTAERVALMQSLRGAGYTAGEASPGDGPRRRHDWIGTRRDGFEPFGFKDNISDPVIEGSGKPVTPGNGVWDPEIGQWRAVRTGEALLGYIDESGSLAGHPDAAHIERNGSYLVVRKLEQDVERFWQECAAWADEIGLDQPDGKPPASVTDSTGAGGPTGNLTGAPADASGSTPDDIGPTAPRADPTWEVAVAARTTSAGKVAAQLVGRMWDGTVLGRPAGDPTNDFLYRDPHRSDGIAVSPSAHIRRAHPRDAIGEAQSLVPRHLLFRRGMPYYEPGTTEGVDWVDTKVPASRGLLFMACCADIGRQFEFVQARWLQDGSRFGLGRERDPLTGTRPPTPPPGAPPVDPDYPEATGYEDAYPADIDPQASIDHDGARCRRPLPEFVHTRGGEYFLLPSRSALLLLGDPNRTP